MATHVCLARQITLKHGEDELLAADPSHAAPRTNDHSLSLVGRVVIDRELSINSIRANVRRLLNPVKGVDIKGLGPNMVVMHFAHPLDRKHALGGCPWAIDRHALLLEPLDPAIKPEHHKLTHMPIMIRVLQLSVSNRSESIARLIGNSLGTFLEIPKSTPNHYLPYFRFKIAVDISNLSREESISRVSRVQKNGFRSCTNVFPPFAFSVAFWGTEKLNAQRDMRKDLRSQRVIYLMEVGCEQIRNLKEIGA